VHECPRGLEAAVLLGGWEGLGAAALLLFVGVLLGLLLGTVTE
jgi:hypothetical protein